MIEQFEVEKYERINANGSKAIFIHKVENTEFYKSKWQWKKDGIIQRLDSIKI